MTVTINWLEKFDHQAGLWWNHRKAHVRPLLHLGDQVHPGPDAVSRMIIAGELGQLDQLPVTQIINAIAQMQLKRPGAHQGGMKWYQEDPDDNSTDSNASFFTGLGLITLWFEHQAHLSAQTQATMLEIFTGLRECFLNDKIGQRLFHCTNVIAGDLACAWLLSEILELQDRRDLLLEEIRDALTYWCENGFGFGEHLSDVYGRVSLTQLSSLLVYAKQLPDDVLVLLKKTINQLLAIDDAFADGPRMPTLRCSALLQSPSRSAKYQPLIAKTFRQGVTPVTHEEWKQIGNMPQLAGVFHRRGWHDMVDPLSPKQQQIQVPCMRGSATAFIESDMRIGSLSQFPIMPEAEFECWGLAWQSFPAGYWHKEGDWGFFQWQINEKSVDQQPIHRCYPGDFLENDAFRRGSFGPNAVLPPIMGRSYALQNGGDVLVLRIMPMLAQCWDSVTDRFRLLDCPVDMQLLESAETGNWRQATIERAQRTISIQHVALTPGSQCVMDREGNRQDYSSTFSRDAFVDNKQRMLITLWGLSSSGKVTEPPHWKTTRQFVPLPRMPNETAVDLHWQWPETNWRVRIDPFAPEPLINLR